MFADALESPLPSPTRDDDEAAASVAVIEEKDESRSELARLAKPEGERASRHPRARLAFSESYALLVKVSETLAEALILCIVVEALGDVARSLSSVGESRASSPTAAAAGAIAEASELAEEKDDRITSTAVELDDALAPSFELDNETMRATLGTKSTIVVNLRGAPFIRAQWLHDGVALNEAET